MMQFLSKAAFGNGQLRQVLDEVCLSLIAFKLNPTHYQPRREVTSKTPAVTFSVVFS
jgi:hypothetical protein